MTQSLQMFKTINTSLTYRHFRVVIRRCVINGLRCIPTSNVCSCSCDKSVNERVYLVEDIVYEDTSFQDRMKIFMLKSIKLSIH